MESSFVVHAIFESIDVSRREAATAQRESRIPASCPLPAPVRKPHRLLAARSSRVYDRRLASTKNADRR
jgi:hypothetical protein